MKLAKTIRRRAGNWSLNVALIALGIAIVIPFYWAVVETFIPRSRVFALPPEWVPISVTFDNYVRVFQEVPFALMIFNSIKIAGIVTVGSLGVAALAAYAFSRLEFRGRDLLFGVFLAALMVPHSMTFIPTFILMRYLGLLDTHEAVYLPGLISVFSIFLLRQFFRSIPRDLDDAAKIDGAGHLRILWHVMLPLARPALAGLAVLQFQFYMNDFFWPLVVLSTKEKMTVPLGLVRLAGEYNTGPTEVTLAGIAIVSVPVLIVFVFTQRFVTRSLAIASR